MSMKISVIMGIYNCQNTLGEAIQCILQQTYSDWELIMCDDGSSDDTYNVALAFVYKYPNRIKLLRNTKNMGLNYALNRCLEFASGEIIARMDGDDRCSENRFEKQIQVLEENPDIAIISTSMACFDETGVWGEINHPEYPKKADFIKESPFCHASCMIRKFAMDAVGGYTVSKRLLRVEDYHLWYKLYKAGYKGNNIQQSYYQMRDDRNAYRRRKYRYRINEAYVKYLVVKDFHLPFINYFYVIKPLIVGILPPALYNYLHKKRLSL